MPYELRKYNDDYNFKSRYGRVESSYVNVTFNKGEAKDHASYEYIAPGHPLLESVNQQAIDKIGNAEIFAIFGDETNIKEGLLWFIEGELTDGLGQIAGKRIFCLFQDMKGVLTKLSPSVIWDLKPLESNFMSESIKRNLQKKSEIEGYIVTKMMFPFLEEIKKRRQRESEIKQKYGLRSLEYLLQESNDKLLHYQEQLDAGKDMNLAIHNEELREKDLESKLTSLKKEIELEMQLTVSEPRVIGVAAVLPINRITSTPDTTTQTGPGMVRDEEIELAGMEHVKKHEISQGWVPEDIHKDNLGFDIRSTKYNGDGTFEDIRYIEVKSRAKDGSIRLTANEWKKAKRFQDKYWLYVVSFAGTSDPKLEKFQNPTFLFTIDEDIYATGYIIPKEKLVKKVKS